jgi:hypothetical protein
MHHCHTDIVVAIAIAVQHDGCSGEAQQLERSHDVADRAGGDGGRSVARGTAVGSAVAAE